VAWVVETLGPVVDSDLAALPADMRAKFSRISDLIESTGLDRVGFPNVRHLQGRLWEIRLRGRDGIARAIYVAAAGQPVVVVRVFVKKTEKTPARELKLALKRAEEVT
jgi:phage-related protein